MKKISKIKKLTLSVLVAGASFFSSEALAQNVKRYEVQQPVPYLNPTTYTSLNPTTYMSQSESKFVFIHGLNQTSSAWAPLDQKMQNVGYQAVPINLPNQGHNGYEQNRIVLNNTLSNLKGANTFFMYSTGAVSFIRYAEENPRFLENIKGSTFIFLEPAIKLNSSIEALASPPMRPIVAPALGRLTPSQTENELTRGDNNHFIDITRAGLPTLGANLAKNGITTYVIGFNSGIVNGSAINSMVNTFKVENAIVYQHTVADVMNNFVPPVIGNKGIFPIGNDTLRVATLVYNRKSASHFIWGSTLKAAIPEFVVDIGSRATNVKLDDIVLPSSNPAVSGVLPIRPVSSIPQNAKLDNIVSSTPEYAYVTGTSLWTANIRPALARQVSDIISSSGTLQNYPTLSSPQLQVIGTGELAEQIRATTNPIAILVSEPIKTPLLEVYTRYSNPAQHGNTKLIDLIPQIPIIPYIPIPQIPIIPHIGNGSNHCPNHTIGCK